MTEPTRPLSPAELLELRRWNTPTIYNGWEQLTRRDAAAECFNLEPTTDFMPQMGPMVGYAITVVHEPSNPEHKKANPAAWGEYQQYVASVPAPKIVIVQDLDDPPGRSAFWGEVTANFHRALGCVGTICDGAIRDLDEMTAAGFKALARCMAVGHGHSTPVRWGCPVEAFGCTIQPGDLVHADKHGFLAVPPEDQPRLLEAARFMDSNECQTLIAAARDTAGLSPAEIVARLHAASAAFAAAARKKFGRGGEWEK